MSSRRKTSFADLAYLRKFEFHDVPEMCLDELPLFVFEEYHDGKLSIPSEECIKRQVARHGAMFPDVSSLKVIHIVECNKTQLVLAEGLHKIPHYSFSRHGYNSLMKYLVEEAKCPPEKIKLYNRNRSYCERSSAIRVYNPQTPEWSQVAHDLSLIDVIPFMRCWTRDGAFVVSPGTRGNDAVSAGVSSRNYKDRTKLSRVAIPALLKGTEHAVDNMVVLSRVLNTLGVGTHAADEPGGIDGVPLHSMGQSTDTTDGVHHSDALVRLNLFARSLDPANILEGLTGAVMDLATNNLHYHVDALDDRNQGNNFTIIFSFLCGERTGFPVEKPSRVLRFSLLGYQRKVVGDFLRRWKKQLRYLDEITKGFDSMGNCQINYDMYFFEKSSPDCIVGISSPTKNDPTNVERKAFGLPMCMNRNLYASAFVHAIRTLYESDDCTLVTDDLFELVLVVAQCNDNFKFPYIVQGWIHDKSQESETCPDVRQFRLPFYILWKMQVVFGSRVAGVMSVGSQCRTISDAGIMSQVGLAFQAGDLRDCVEMIRKKLENTECQKTPLPAAAKSTNEKKHSQQSSHVLYTHDVGSPLDFNYLVECLEGAIPYHDYYSLECAVRVLALLGLLGAKALPLVTPYAITSDVSESVCALAKKAEPPADSPIQKLNKQSIYQITEVVNHLLFGDGESIPYFAANLVNMWLHNHMEPERNEGGCRTLVFPFQSVYDIVHGGGNGSYVVLEYKCTGEVSVFNDSPYTTEREDVSEEDDDIRLGIKPWFGDPNTSYNGIPRRPLPLAHICHPEAGVAPKSSGEVRAELSIYDVGDPDIPGSSKSISECFASAAYWYRKYKNNEHAWEPPISHFWKNYSTFQSVHIPVPRDVSDVERERVANMLAQIEHRDFDYHNKRPKLNMNVGVRYIHDGGVTIMNGIVFPKRLGYTQVLERGLGRDAREGMCFQSATQQCCGLELDPDVREEIRFPSATKHGEATEVSAVSASLHNFKQLSIADNALGETIHPIVTHHEFDLLSREPGSAHVASEISQLVMACHGPEANKDKSYQIHTEKRLVADGKYSEMFYCTHRSLEGLVEMGDSTGWLAMPMNLASGVDGSPHFAEDGQHERHRLYLSQLTAKNAKKLQISMHCPTSEGCMHTFLDRKLRKFPNAKCIFLTFKFTGGKTTRFEGPLILIQRDISSQSIMVYMKATVGDRLRNGICESLRINPLSVKKTAESSVSSETRKQKAYQGILT